MSFVQFHYSYESLRLPFLKITTDKGTNECAETHGGTSAAAPNVAGVFTLAVQAR